MDSCKMFDVQDPWVAAAIIILSGVEPEMATDANGTYTLFQFPRTDTVLDAMDGYTNGAKVVGKDYAYTVKRLKSEIFGNRKATSSRPKAVGR